MAVVAANPLIEVVPGLMIWTLLCFGITFFVLRRYIFGPVQTAIDARRDRIRQAIEEADKARAEARQLLEEHRALIQSARGDAEQILAEARRVADAQRDRMKEELEAERQRRLDDTAKQIEAETRRALEQIRGEVANLTVIATSKVTGKVLTDEDHRRLIDEAIGDLDFSVLEEGSATNAPPGHTPTSGPRSRGARAHPPPPRLISLASSECELWLGAREPEAGQRRPKGH